MNNSFTQKSKDLSDQELIERIYHPDRFVPSAVKAAYEEIRNRGLEDVNFTVVENYLTRLNDRKQKEEKQRQELLIKEKQTAQADSIRIEERQFASFGSRLLAFLLDLVFCTVAALVVLFFVSPLVQMISILGDEAVIFINNGIFLIVCWFYFSLSEAGTAQATYGKQIMKLKVVKENGVKLDFFKATSRFFLKLLSALILGVGFLLAIFSSTNQALHDDFTGTFVLRLKSDK